MDSHLHHLTINGALFSIWVVGPGVPLQALMHLNIFAPDPHKAIEHTELVLPPLNEFLNTLKHMPMLEAIAFCHCLLPFDLSYLTWTVPPPPHLCMVNFHDCIDRCQQVLDTFNILPTTTIKVFCLSGCPPSEQDCLCILPSLSTHLSCPPAGRRVR